MNIFYLHEVPETAARYLCDKHINKMLIESVQMLSTCHHVIGSGSNAMYRPAFQNHPCAIWVRESAQNYYWLRDHALQIGEEFLIRYGKVHASTVVLNALPDPDLPLVGITPPAQAMPDEYKNDDAVQAYRDYYLYDKRRFAKWERGIPAPYWWSEK